MKSSQISTADDYRKAGVDIEGADRWIGQMQRLIRSTPQRGVMQTGGRFAGLYDLGTRFGKDTVLVSSTDGVGTKLLLAQEVNRHQGIGVDAVAMNSNDVLVQGAHPLFFLDYIAVGSLQPKVMTELMKGVVEGCKQSDCALLGGETAEMPGVYKPHEYEIVGFCVGAVSNRKRVTGEKVKRGDAIVGVASNGVHANGFSLVRRVFSKAELVKHKQQLLAPTRIYVKPVLKALETLPIRAMSHITGGGLARRIPALVGQTTGLRAELFPKSWRVPPVFKKIQAAGALSDASMQATFNMGVGFALVCPSAATDALIQIFADAGMPAWVVGTVDKN